jgi:drug/metabolite transporter (DMT)-like permease
MINTFLFFTLATFWGGSFIAIKYIITDIPAFTAAFYRVFFATIFLILIYIRSFRIDSSLWSRELLFVSTAGLCSIGVPFSLLFWGEQYISASIAGILNGTVPFWTLLRGLVFLSDSKKLTRRKTMGLIMGFLGIFFIFGPKVRIQGNIDEIYGLLAITLMAMFYGIGTNLNRRIITKNKKITDSKNIIIQHLIASIYLGILSLSIDGPFNLDLLLKPSNMIALFYLSFISTTLAFIIFFKLIKEIGSVEASSVTFFVPAIALILDILINSHVLDITEAIGTLIIFLSMILLKERRSKS